MASRLQELLDLIHELLKIAGSHSKLKELEGVRVAERFLKEQTYYDYREDSYSAKNSKDIEATSLQSAFDPDATYRRKGSKQAVGYVLNVTETCGDNNHTSFLKRALDFNINKKRVRRIMRDMGIYTLYPKPNLSRRYHAQYVHPYLLRNLAITGPDQVWGVAITYIRMKKGFMYLFVIIDWYSRYIVDYELSSTIDKSVLNCLKRVLATRQSGIINGDQGGHFTNQDYITLLQDHGVKISMDGKGQCLDNARTERFFRTLKYDRIYINEYETPRELRSMLNEYMETYNTRRPHSSLGGSCPADYCLKSKLTEAA